MAIINVPIGPVEAARQTGVNFAQGLVGRGGDPRFMSVDPVTGAPPTGLIGSENALTSSADAQLRILRAARNRAARLLEGAGGKAAGEIAKGGRQATGFLETSVGEFDPFRTQGVDAGGIQAALAGAMGPEAQREALANLQPVNDFLAEQGQRAVLRNAAAIGGLGSGNVQKELVRFGQGLAGQSAQQQFANLGTIAGRGMDALRARGDLRRQQGDIALQTARERGAVAQRTGQDIARSLEEGARSLSGVIGGTGQLLASGRTAAGRDLAGAVSGTTSALSNLINQQGGQAAGTIGTVGSNLANLLAGAGQQEAGSNQQLATLLANLSTQQASQVAGLPTIPGVQQTSGILPGIGRAASGVGTVLGVL